MIGLGSRRAVMAAFLALPFAAVDADAQAVTLAGGARMYDAGSMPMVALRTEFPLPGPLLLEFAGSVADPHDDAPRSAASLLEAQLQVEVPLGSVITPYLGGGIGAAKTYTLGEEDDEGETLYSLGVGARVAFSEQLGLVIDARMRDIGRADDDDHTDVSVGLRYQFLPRDRPRFRGAPRRGDG
jgi:Outer membrane protein beta-barrel domain